MQYRFILACAIATPVAAGYLVPRHSLEELVLRDLYSEQDLSSALNARSVYYDEQDFGGAFVARSGLYDEDGLLARDERVLRLYPRADDGRRSASSYYTALSQAERGGQAPQRSSTLDSVKDAAKATGQFVQKHPDIPATCTAVAGGAAGLAAAATGKHGAAIAGGAANLVISTKKALGEDKKGGGKRRRSLDDSLDILYERRSAGMEFDELDHFLLVRALDSHKALQARDLLEEELFGLDYI